MKVSDLIIEKNNQYIIAKKPAGMPMIDDKTKDTAFVNILRSYTKAPLSVIHRIDRPVSGIVVLAKSEKAESDLARQIQEREFKKRYLAIVSKGKLPQKGKIENYLKRDGHTKKAFISDIEKTGYRKASLEYRIIDNIENYDLVEVNLHTGRFHQIRAQLANLGAPIKGDVKYGARRGNKDRSISLHAFEISFFHPVNHKKMTYNSLPSGDDIWDAFKVIKEWKKDEQM